MQIFRIPVDFLKVIKFSLEHFVPTITFRKSCWQRKTQQKKNTTIIHHTFFNRITFLRYKDKLKKALSLISK